MKTTTLASYFSTLHLVWLGAAVAGEPWSASVPSDPGGTADSGKATVTLLDDAEDHWLPFSLELNYVNQTQDYEITGLETDFEPPVIVAPTITVDDVQSSVPANLPPFIRNPILAQAVKEAQKIADEAAAEARAQIPTVDENLVEGIENHAETVTMRLGYSPVPFFTVFGIGGYVDGEVDVQLAEPFDDLNVGYEGWVYGGGATVAVGYKCLFASATGTYTIADLKDQGDAQIDTFVFLPKVGVHGERGALWVGAQYQSTKHTQVGEFDIEPLGPVGFEVELEDAENWNWLVGGRLNVSERFYLTVEGGFGERQQALVGAGFRF